MINPVLGRDNLFYIMKSFVTSEILIIRGTETLSDDASESDRPGFIDQGMASASRYQKQANGSAGP